MALFNFGKKKTVAEGCCRCSEPDAKCHINSRVKVLGAGCKSCHELYEKTKTVADKFGIGNEVTYITDMPTVTLYAVMKLPALVIDEKVVSQGKLLSESDIEKLLKKEGVIDA